MVHIVSTQSGITIAAPQHLLLTSGGAYIKLEGGNIDVHGPGIMAFNASQTELAGPGNASSALALPEVQALYNEAFTLKNKKTGEIIPHGHYRIENAQGMILAEGHADEMGRTVRVINPKAEQLNVFVLDNSSVYNA